MTHEGTGFWAFFRENLWLFLGFLMALGIFVAGLNVLFDQSPDDPGARENVVAPNDTVRLGPEPGQELGPYITEKTELLSGLAASISTQEDVAVVSFDVYERRLIVESVEDSGVEIVFILVRVPLGNAIGEVIGVPPDPPLSVLGRWRERALKSHTDEVLALEEIIPTVRGEDFRKTYLEDLELNRQAVELLAARDPAVIYGLVVNGAYSELKALTGLQGVRHVDIPEGRRGAKAYEFVGLRPEWEDSVPENVF